MKKLLPYAYLFIPTVYAFAQADDGHGHVHGVPEVADPSSRIYVMVGVGVVFALMIAWFVWSKRKSSQ